MTYHQAKSQLINAGTEEKAGKPDEGKDTTRQAARQQDSMGTTTSTVTATEVAEKTHVSIEEAEELLKVGAPTHPSSC